ncbi:ATPase [Microterricola viridarii]|uniref:ATPase n=2 Tax=Microterricola viridarii TaxID=412690 RepID=A0A0Y0NG41_9MICO|nr:ATPase [Microterricola viridarii]
MIDLVYASADATLNVGSILGADNVSARLIPKRFNRHTFWCGQSGSGKTYALGVLIEQLLIRTRLPMVIFDPNADFVRIGDLSTHGEAAESAEEAALLQSRDIRVLRPDGTDGADPLLVRFTELSMPSKAAVLRLDPLTDRAEYNELLHFERTIGSRTPEDIIPKLLQSESAAARALAARIENLRLIDWELWAGDRVSVTDVIRERPDATVLDLGGFNHPDEYLVVALSVLDELWERREERKPILIVIDEAHNLCSPEHNEPLDVAVRERITQIAAEGRKFGLWLLLSTQRPSKVASGILSQCDNVAVMRMSSPADLGELAVRFGFVPADMLARTTGFRQGEAFFAGGFVPAPTLATMRTRLTVEGGADVRVPLRADGARP